MSLNLVGISKTFQKTEDIIQMHIVIQLHVVKYELQCRLTAHNWQN